MGNKDFNINQLVRKNVLEMSPYSSARDEFKETGSDFIFLDANENPFESGLNRYPDPKQRDLKEKLAELKGVNTEQILFGNGSDEVLDLIFRVFCEPSKDNIITLPPTYGMYNVLAKLNNIKNIEVPLTTDFEIDITSTLNQVNINTKLIFLCSPNNPTANSLQPEKIETLLKSFKGIVVIDEAYIDFSENESWSKKLNEYPNLVVCQTFSKAYGMAGIRLGVAYASKEIIQILHKIKPPYNVNILTQTKAISKLERISEVRNQIDILKEERHALIGKLKEVSFIKKVYPSDANFILAKVDNANLRYDQLISVNIVVRDRSSQPLCEECLRFTVGTPEENQKLIETLQGLNNYPK